MTDLSELRNLAKKWQSMGCNCALPHWDAEPRHCLFWMAQKLSAILDRMEAAPPEDYAAMKEEYKKWMVTGPASALDIFFAGWRAARAASVKAGQESPLLKEIRKAVEPPAPKLTAHEAGCHCSQTAREAGKSPHPQTCPFCTCAYGAELKKETPVPINPIGRPSPPKPSPSPLSAEREAELIAMINRHGSSCVCCVNLKDLVPALDATRKERDDARELSKFMMCSYCGEKREKPQGTWDEIKTQMVEHILVCKENPIAKLSLQVTEITADRDRLQKENEQRIAEVRLEEHEWDCHECRSVHPAATNVKRNQACERRAELQAAVEAARKQP